jgi:hypothetical protein
MMNKIDPIVTSFAVAAAKKEAKKVEDKLSTVFEDFQSIQGPMGNEGPRGPIGEQGPKGAQGMIGPRGEKGDKGEKGEKGDKGDQGEQGIQGIQGNTGEKGEKGETGPRGEKGEQGEVGPMGPTGEMGPQGERGEQGLRGADGESGPQGERGETGATGDVGPAGPQGPKGEKGDQGEKGEKGDRGEVGQSVDKKEIEEQINNLFEDAKTYLDSQQKQLQESLDATQLQDLTEFKTKLKKEVSDTIEQHKKFIDTQISNKWASSAGGGSVNILQMDDVEFKKRHLVEGDAILIFDDTKKKFVSESFNDIIERLQVGMEVQYDRLVDTEGVYTYIGEAVPGSARDAAVWRIKRVYEQGDDIEIIWANNSANTEFVWDDRATYEYN